MKAVSSVLNFSGSPENGDLDCAGRLHGKSALKIRLRRTSFFNMIFYLPYYPLYAAPNSLPVDPPPNPLKGA
jgi:hypothetical protein